MTLFEHDQEQLSQLGRLLSDRKSMRLVREILKQIATVPKHYGVLNDFIRQHFHLLKREFSFLLRSKDLLDFENKKRWFHQQLDEKKKLSYTLESTTLEIRRDNLFMDAFVQLYDIDPLAPLWISKH